MGRLGGALVGAAFLVWIAGVSVLDPGDIGWMMRFDWPIHFFGWHFFRSEPWAWPPGLITRYYYPIGTSIGFTDSIPLMALLLKPIQAWLPATFQYLGAWLLLCFAAQGYFGALLTGVWTRRVTLQVAGAALFVLMPTLLVRVGHPALCAHWLLLWALWIALRPESGVGSRESGVGRTATAVSGIGEWITLGLFAGLIHPYLAVMTLALLAAATADRVLRRSSDSRLAPASRVKAAMAFAAAVAAIGSGWWISGLFSVAGAESLATEGLGHYSMNLLSPLSPTGGFSRFLPDWPRATPGQDYEGFQYFGLGVFALMIAAVALRARSRLDTSGDPGPGPRRLLPLLLVAIAMAVYALSPRVTLGSVVLVDYTGPFTERLAIFRATGRFFWPLGYLLLTLAVATVVTRARPRHAALVLGGAVVLQMIDVNGAHLERRRNAHDPAFHAWAQPMVSAAWGAALAHYDHLVLYPPPQCGPSPMPYEPAAYVAGLHRVTINAGDVARPDVAARLAYCHDLGEAVKAGRVDERSLYIMLPSEVAALRATAVTPVVCGVIDGLSVCATAASYQGWRDAARLD